MHFKLRVSLGFALLLICLPKALAQTGSVAGTAFNHPILNQPVALTSSPALVRSPAPGETTARFSLGLKLSY
jgi:hypothetical protein